MSADLKGGFGSLQEHELPGVSAVTDLFAKEEVECGIAKRWPFRIRPTSLSDTGPIHVHIPADPKYFLDPSSFRLNAVIRVLKFKEGAWVNLDKNDAKLVSPHNSLANNLFSDISIYMQQKQITVTSTPSYPIIHYLESAFNYTTDAEKTVLGLGYWVKDAPGQHEKAESNAWAKRHHFIANSKKVVICQPIRTEVTDLEKVLATNIQIDFHFMLNKVQHILQRVSTNPTEYKITYDDFYLEFNRLELKPELANSIERGLSSGKKAIYEYNKSLLRTKQVPDGELNVMWQSMCHGKLPQTLAICMVDSRTFNGDHAKSPFNFQHFNLSEISIIMNGERMPFTPLLCDFANNEARRAYRHLLDNINVKTSNSPCLIEYEDFLEGSTIFVFDLTPDMSAAYHNHRENKGVIDLDIKFSKPLPDGITIYMVGNYHDILYVTGPPENRLVGTASELV